MNKQDKQFFIKLGIIKGPAKSYNLIFIHSNNNEIILENKAYSLCIWKENQIKEESQYRGGVFSIKPN